jgi:hypothetical protein
MLFNSLPFILGFLPPVLLAYWLLARKDEARLYFLLGASLVFYGYWDWRFEPLLLGSIVFNWLFAEAYFSVRRKSLLIAAIVLNLLSLAVFKYLGFFAGAVRDVTGWNFDVPAMLLPIGISFFTFHKIIYLADLHAGRAPRYSLRDYGLYVALFPQILAGPLVRYYEIVPQFRLSPLREGWEARCVQGIALFIMGLGKRPAETPIAAPDDFTAPPLLRQFFARLDPAARVVIVFPPRYTTAIPPPGSTAAADLDVCKETYRLLAGARANTQFLDFLFDSPMARRDENFWDAIHYRGPVARVIEDRVVDALKR